jgi:hypothetical protein
MTLQTEKDRYGRRFACSIWPKKRERLSPRCFEVEVVQGDECAITAHNLGKPQSESAIGDSRDRIIVG